MDEYTFSTWECSLEFAIAVEAKCCWWSFDGGAPLMVKPHVVSGLLTYDRNDHAALHRRGVFLKRDAGGVSLNGVRVREAQAVSRPALYPPPYMGQYYIRTLEMNLAGGTHITLLAVVLTTLKGYSLYTTSLRAHRDSKDVACMYPVLKSFPGLNPAKFGRPTFRVETTRAYLEQTCDSSAWFCYDAPIDVESVVAVRGLAELAEENPYQTPMWLEQVPISVTAKTGVRGEFYCHNVPYTLIGEGALEYRAREKE